MNQIIVDSNLIAYCGFYCGACKRYLKEKCLGCQKNERATRCKVRTCCIKNHYLSCADCKEVENVTECKIYNNFLLKIFSFILRADREASINLILKNGYDNYAKEMAEKKIMTIRK